jgi:hypothetical protein
MQLIVLLITIRLRKIFYLKSVFALYIAEYLLRLVIHTIITVRSYWKSISA